MGFLYRLLAFGFLSDAMAVCVSGQDQGQSTISGYVTCRTEAVLQSEDGQHQSGTGVVEQQDTSDQSQRGHNRSTWNTWSSDGKDAKQHTEQDHSSQ